MTLTELRAVYPEATILGCTVLHRAGWTTQIPASIHVAVLDTRMPVEIDLYAVVGRPAAWFGERRFAAGTASPAADPGNRRRVAVRRTVAPAAG